jgi:hypothetical protein
VPLVGPPERGLSEAWLFSREDRESMPGWDMTADQIRARLVASSCSNLNTQCLTLRLAV